MPGAPGVPAPAPDPCPDTHVSAQARRYSRANFEFARRAKLIQLKDARAAGLRIGAEVTKTSRRASIRALANRTSGDQIIMNARREFLRFVPVAAAAAALPRVVAAQQTPALAESDKMAVAMGFRMHTQNVDQARYPRHSNEQSCLRCLHYPADGSTNGRCDLFGKLVPSGAWCSGFSRRP